MFFDIICTFSQRGKTGPVILVEKVKLCTLSKIEERENAAVAASAEFSLTNIDILGLTIYDERNFAAKQKNKNLYLSLA